MTDDKRSFWSDERAIEGLPIRLVIALVVGVAALGLMLQVLDGFGGVGNTEVTIEIEDGEVYELGDSTGNLTFSVIDEDGNAVEGATVLLEPGTAQGETVRLDLPEDNETFTREFSALDGGTSFENIAELRSDQNRGTYEFTILPPSDSDWVDEQENPELVVLDN